MPPLKNGSLGRGLGDLLGGVPENLGVAGVSRSPLAPPVRPADGPGVSPADEPPSADQPVSGSTPDVCETPAPQGSALPPVRQNEVCCEGAGARERGYPEMPVAKRCWTPARAVMAFVVGGGLILLAAVMGVWMKQASPAAIPERIVLVTNTVVKTVVAEPAPALVVRPDTTELKALEEQGVTVRVEDDGSARVIFDEPVFSSRAILDPGQSALLDRLGEVMTRHASDWVVQVTGHTDSIAPRQGGPYRDNTELGLARATEVVRYLLRHAEVPAAMLRAATAGDSLPPFPGDDAAARRKNRTVTLTIRPVLK